MSNTNEERHVHHPEVQALLDKQAITETLMRYCRAVDRFDFQVLDTVFWPEARDQHVIFDGDPREFVTFVRQFMGSCEQSSHQITNVLIDLEGRDRARVESYVWTFQDPPIKDGESTDLIVAGRYLDRFEKRGNEWRIIDRILTVDCVQMLPSSADWGPEGLYAELKTRGVRYPHDPLYTRLLRPAFEDRQPKD